MKIIKNSFWLILTVGERWNARWRQPSSFVFSLFAFGPRDAAGSEDRERKTDMIGCPFLCCAPIVLLWATHSFHWCNTNIVLQSPLVLPFLPFLLPQLQNNLHLHLHLCLCSNSPSLIPFLCLRSARSHLSIFRPCYKFLGTSLVSFLVSPSLFLSLL